MPLIDWIAPSWAFTSGAVSIVLRSSVLAIFCAGAAWLLRSRTAELRFVLWQWTLFALLALPLLMVIVPPLPRTSQAFPRVEAMVSISPGTATVPPRRTQRTFSIPDIRRQQLWILFVPGLYFLVAMALLARLAYNLHGLRQIAGRSQFIREERLRHLAHDIWLESGTLPIARLAESSEVSGPVTFDADDTWILLPQSWRTWEEAKLRAVLTHEMAHVKRGDSGSLLLVSLATCLFWFHPLSWFLRRQLSALAEEACDEIVVASRRGAGAVRQLPDRLRGGSGPRARPARNCSNRKVFVEAPD